MFRNRERGALHHPEFTMLEWYRADEAYEALMDDCAAMLSAARGSGGHAAFRFRGRSRSFRPAGAPHGGRGLRPPCRHRSAGDARDREALAALRPRGRACASPRDDSWADIFSRILVEKIEPHLGIGRATILYEYPAAEAALARRTAHDPRWPSASSSMPAAWRLANAFGELTDAAEQRQRFKAEMDEKERIHGERYPVDEDFLDALAHMPPACGIALGFDRLVMLATGAQRIEQVIWTPVDPRIARGRSCGRA